MSTKDNFKKTLRFSDETDRKLTQLSQKFGRSKFAIFNLMVDYFYRTNKDPGDMSDELLKKTLVKNHDIYTGFIRMQEKVLLVPLHQNVEKMIRNQEQIVKFFNEQVLKANKEISKTQNEVLLRIDNMDRFLKAVAGERNLKQNLKHQFSGILEYYIKSRETIGAFNSKGKEELVQEVKNQLAEI